MDASRLAHSIVAFGRGRKNPDDDLAFGPGGDPVYPTPVRVTLTMETTGPFGRVAHFKPVPGLSGTPGFYATSPDSFGTSPAASARPGPGAP